MTKTPPLLQLRPRPQTRRLSLVNTPTNSEVADDISNVLQRIRDRIELINELMQEVQGEQPRNK